jgi:hypothetical protein
MCGGTKPTATTARVIALETTRPWRCALPYATLRLEQADPSLFLYKGIRLNGPRAFRLLCSGSLSVKECKTGIHFKTIVAAQ